MYMLILNFTYPLRCLRVPPVEYHCPTAILSTIHNPEDHNLNYVLFYLTKILPVDFWS